MNTSIIIWLLMGVLIGWFLGYRANLQDIMQVAQDYYYKGSKDATDHLNKLLQDELKKAQTQANLKKETTNEQ